MTEMSAALRMRSWDARGAAVVAGLQVLLSMAAAAARRPSRPGARSLYGLRVNDQPQGRAPAKSGQRSGVRSPALSLGRRGPGRTRRAELGALGAAGEAEERRQVRADRPAGRGRPGGGARLARRPAVGGPHQAQRERLH